MSLPTENNPASETEEQTKGEEVSTFTETTDTIPETEPSETTVNPSAPPDDMILLGDVAEVPPSMAVYECEVENDGVGSAFHHVEEIDLYQRTSLTKSELAQSVLSRPFLDAGTEATYTSSNNTVYYNENTDRYDGSAPYGATYRIEINSNTQKLYSFRYEYQRVIKIDGRYYESTVLDDLDLPPLTEEECTKIAETVFYKEMGAVGDYTMSVRYHPVPEFANGYYLYTFTRRVGGAKTNELVFIKITDKGRIYEISSYAFGSFDNVTLPEYDEEKAFEAVEYKLADIYEDVLGTKSLYYKADPPVLVRLSDGKIYLKYPLDVQIYTSEGKLFAHDRTNLLVCIS